jgi:hypothetical protein
MDRRVGEDHEIKLGFVHRTAQGSIERRCGGLVLLAVPSVSICNAAEAGNAKRAEAIP